MDNLNKFKQENITNEVIAEINSLTNEQLEQLSNEKVTLLIRDKKNKTTSHTGLATYKSLLSLSKLNLKHKYDVVGFVNKKTNVVAPISVKIKETEFIQPETPLIDDVIEFENFEEETKETFETPKKQKRGRKRTN